MENIDKSSGINVILSLDSQSVYGRDRQKRQ